MGVFGHRYIKDDSYFPVDKYGLWVYNCIGYVGNSLSTKNIRLYNVNTALGQDFLFDGSAFSKAAITTWAGGSLVRVSKLYNEGLGGSNFDFIQNTVALRPYFDLTNWVIDFSGGDYFLETTSHTSITDKDSTTLVSFKTQSTLAVEGVLQEQSSSAVGNRNAIYSDTRTSIFRLYNYAPNATDSYINLTSQTAINTNRVLGQRKVGTSVKGYANGSLINSITSSNTFGGVNTFVALGFQRQGSQYFNGKTKGIIVHNAALSEVVYYELENHIKIV